MCRPRPLVLLPPGQHRWCRPTFGRYSPSWGGATYSTIPMDIDPTSATPTSAGPTSGTPTSTGTTSPAPTSAPSPGLSKPRLTLLEPTRPRSCRPVSIVHRPCLQHPEVTTRRRNPGARFWVTVRRVNVSQAPEGTEALAPFPVPLL